MAVSIRLNSEDEYDLAVYREALEEYNKNPVSYSHAEVRKMLGI